MKRSGECFFNEPEGKKSSGTEARAGDGKKPASAASKSLGNAGCDMPRAGQV